MSSRSKSKPRRVSSARNFALLLGLIMALIFGLFIFLDVFAQAERRAMDLHFKVKDFVTYLSRNVDRSLQSGVTSQSGVGRKISDDIVLVGVDDQTLAVYGRWPFPRAVHAGLLNAITRIGDQDRRESAVLLDFLFFNPAEPAYQDVILLDSMKENGNVLLQTQFYNHSRRTELEDEGLKRLNILVERLGEIRNVSGNTGSMKRWYGIEAPLPPYARSVASYGYATYASDQDDIFRRLQLVSVYSSKVHSTHVDTLDAGQLEQYGAFGHLSYPHRDGYVPVGQLPMTDEEFEEFKKEVRRHGVEENPGKGDYQVSLYRDYYVPATALNLAMQYFNKELQDIEVVVGSHIRIPSPEVWDGREGQWVPYEIRTRRGRQILDEIRIPIDDNGGMLINYMGERSSTSPEAVSTYPVRSYVRTVERNPAGADPRTWDTSTMGWDGKVVMVGAFTKAMADDEKTTPLGLMFGVEMQANALNTILMNNFIYESPWWYSVILMLVMVALVTLVTSRLKRLGWAAFFLGLTGLISLAIVEILFIESNVLVGWFTPAIAAVAVYIAVMIYRVLTAERDRRQIKNVFGQYVSPKVVDQLVESSEPPKLGGEEKDVTVFFSDIRKFSMISEKLNDSEELVSLLNAYFDPMTANIVDETNGTLDKYIGDAIMAFWGAPVAQDVWTAEEHAVAACKSALQQLQILEKSVNTWIVARKEEDPDYPIDRIDIGIGIHSGKATIGNMGSDRSKNYTAMGDPVNLASRLEGVNKLYGTRIIISEETRRRIKDEPFIVRELDTIRVVGRFNDETIYELVGFDGEL